MGIDTASELFRATDEMLNDAFNRKKSNFISDEDYCCVLDKAGVTLRDNIDNLCQHSNPKISVIMKSELQRTISIINSLREKTYCH